MISYKLRSCFTINEGWAPVATRAVNPGVVSSNHSSANILSDVWQKSLWHVSFVFHLWVNSLCGKAASCLECILYGVLVWERYSGEGIAYIVRRLCTLWQVFEILHTVRYSHKFSKNNRIQVGVAPWWPLWTKSKMVAIWFIFYHISAPVSTYYHIFYVLMVIIYFCIQLFV